MPNAEIIWEDNEDRKVLSACGFQLLFARAADRWTHRLECATTGQLLASPLEMEAEGADPASIVGPVYQEIHAHELDGVSRSLRYILLTGRLFDHQFSAAVAFAIHPAKPNVVNVEWDVADRCRTHISHLAATYQLPLLSGDLTDATPNSIRWTSPSQGAGSLELIAGPPENVALAEAGRNGTRVQAVAKLEPGTFTHRLRYRWRWEAEPDSSI